MTEWEKQVRDAGGVERYAEQGQKQMERFLSGEDLTQFVREANIRLADGDVLFEKRFLLPDGSFKIFYYRQ